MLQNVDSGNRVPSISQSQMPISSLIPSALCSALYMVGAHICSMQQIRIQNELHISCDFLQMLNWKVPKHPTTRNSTVGKTELSRAAVTLENYN